MENRNREQRIFWNFIFAIFILVLLISYSRFSIFPYYFQFDTDATVAIDVLLINSHYLPDHVQHPSYGMYMLLSLVSETAKSWGFIAISNLTDLQNCLNLATCMAEYTGFLRSFSPAISALIPLLITAALYIGFKQKVNLKLIALFAIILFFEETLAYNSLIIKSEIYSALFWSLGLVFVALSVRANFKSHTVYLVIAGIFAGLCLTTKVQFIFYVFALFIFYFLLSTHSQRWKNYIYSPKLLLTINSLSILLITGAFYVSYTFSFKVGFSNVFTIGGLNTIGALILMSILATSVVSGLVMANKIKSTQWVQIFTNVSFLNFGIVLSFFAAFVLQMFVNNSSMIMHQALQMTFFREMAPLLPAGPATQGYFDYMREFLLARWDIYALVIVCGIGVIVANVMYNKNRRDDKKWSGTFITALIVLLLILVLTNMYIAVRPVMRDVFVIKLLMFIFLFLAVATYVETYKNSKYIRISAYAILGVTFLVNVPYYFQIKNNIIAENSHYGFGDYHWVTGVYDANHTIYKNIMMNDDKAASGQGWHNSRLKARNISNNKNILGTIFINQSIDTKKISYLHNGFPIFSKNKNIRIKKAPWYLIGSLTYNNKYVLSNANQVLPGSFIRSPNIQYFFDKPRAELSQKIDLAILPRADQKLYMYLLKGEYSDVAKEYRMTNEAGNEIEMDNGDVYEAYRLVEYTEIDNDMFIDDYFFLIIAN